MDARTYLDRLAERARLDDALVDAGAMDRFVARVWWKVDVARRELLAAPDATPLWVIMGTAAVAAGVMLAWSMSLGAAIERDSAAPSFVQDLFTLAID